MAVSKASANAITPAAKGAMAIGSGTNTASILTVGSNDQVLTADSTQTTGVKWATPVSGGMTLLDSGTLSGASVTTASLSSSYNDLYVYLESPKPATSMALISMRFNSDSGANRYFSYGGWNQYDKSFNSTKMDVSEGINNSGTLYGLMMIYIPRYSNTTTWKWLESKSFLDSTVNNFDLNNNVCAYSQTGAISTLTFFPSSGNWTSGNYYVYGVK